MLAVLIGSAKCGTSYFWACTKQHESMNRNKLSKKEPRFFSHNKKYKMGVKAYLVGVPANKPGIALDASPGYMYTKVVPERVYRSFPKATIVALLREPVSRTFSHWRFRRKPARRPPQTKVDFPELVRAGLDRIHSNGLPLNAVTGEDVVAASVYAHYLKRWFRRFPRKQILIYFFEEFIANPSAVLADFFGHHGLDTTIKAEWLDVPKFTSAFKAKLDRESRTALRDFYRPYNNELRELLGRELPSAWQY